jgi:phage gp37-like protein
MKQDKSKILAQAQTEGASMFQLQSRKNVYQKQQKYAVNINILEPVHVAAVITVALLPHTPIFNSDNFV